MRPDEVSDMQMGADSAGLETYVIVIIIVSIFLTISLIAGLILWVSDY